MKLISGRAKYSSLSPINMAVLFTNFEPRDTQKVIPSRYVVSFEPNIGGDGYLRTLRNRSFWYMSVNGALIGFHLFFCYIVLGVIGIHHFQ